MGQAINNRILTATKMLELPSPIILCVRRPDFDKAIKENGYHIVTVNLPLAKALQGRTVQEISTSVTPIIIDLLPKGNAVYLIDYEILFDPRYKLDVMKLFCEISKHNKLIINWCGGSTDDSLTYAEPGYDDYVKYRINDYEIACVI